MYIRHVEGDNFPVPVAFSLPATAPSPAPTKPRSVLKPKAFQELVNLNHFNPQILPALAEFHNKKFGGAVVVVLVVKVKLGVEGFKAKPVLSWFHLYPTAQD